MSRYKVVIQNKEYANEMIKNWKYNGEYSIYDYIHEEEDLLDESQWGDGRFAVLDDKDNLVGELTITFFTGLAVNDDDDDFVEYSDVRSNPDNKYEMWMGWGMRPDLCSKGLGYDFINDCIDFAIKEYKYKGEYVRCGVAAFNERAVKLYERMGFETFHTCEGEIADKMFKIYQMKKKIK